MILRRPYAFLIKYFRLIHLVITAILAFVVLKCRGIYKYLSSVISDSVNRYNAASYINYGVFVLIVLAIALCLVVYWLLKYKDKPRKIYIFAVVGYGIIAIFLFVLFSYISGFNNNVVDQKTIRLYRDLMLMVLLFQYYVIAFMFIRGLGFDIKRFNFGKDVQELNATAEDAEEIEINTQIDTTNVARGIRRQGREFGYFVKEFKMYIIVVVAALLLFGGYKGYKFYDTKFKVYSQNQTVGSLYQVSVQDSYYYIDEEFNYVIINFDISKAGMKDTFNTANLVLQIGRNKYPLDKNICYKFSKLGSCYKKQYVDSNTKNYIVTFEVDNLNVDKAYLLYSESYDKTYKIKLKMQDFENE